MANEAVYKILVDMNGMEGAMRGLDDLTHRLSVSTAALVALDTVAAQALIKYEYAIARVSTVSEDVLANTAAFSQGISDLTQNVDNSTNKIEAANAAYEIASSGFSEQTDILHILERSTKTAVAGFTDVVTVADATTKVYNSYKASAQDLGDVQSAMNRITDEAIIVQNLGIITVGQYATQIGRVSAAAASAGISLEEVNAYIAAATRNGVPARQAFTALQATIASIVTPSQQAIRESARIGVAFDAETLKARGLSYILNELAANTNKTAETQGLLFNSVEAFKGVSAVGGDNIAQFNDFLKQMGVAASSSGAQVDKAYDIMASTKQLKATQAMNAISDTLIELGKGVAVVIEPVAAAIKYLSENFENLPEPIKQGVGMFLLLAGGAATLGLALVVTVGYIVGVTNSLRKVGGWLNGAKVSFNDLFDTLFNRNKEFVQTATLMNDMSNSTTSQLSIEERQVRLLKAAYDGLNISKSGGIAPTPPGPISPVGPNPGGIVPAPIVPAGPGLPPGPSFPALPGDAQVNALTESWKKFSQEIGKAPFKNAVEDFQRLNQATTGAIARIDSSALALNGLNNSVLQSQRALREVVDQGYYPSSKALIDLFNATEVTAGAQKTLIGRAGLARSAFAQLGDAMGGLVPAAKAYTGALIPMGAGTKAVVASMAVQLAMMAAITAAMWGISKAVEHWDNIKTENNNEASSADLANTQALYSATAREIERLANGGSMSAEKLRQYNTALKGVANENNGLLKLQQQLNSTYARTGDQYDIMNTRAQLSFAQLKVLYEEASRVAKQNYDQEKSRLDLLTAQKVPEAEVLALKLDAAREYSDVITEQKSKELALSRLSVDDRAKATKEIQQAQTEAAKAFDNYVTYLNKRALDQVLEHEATVMASVDRELANFERLQARKKEGGALDEVAEVREAAAATIAANEEKADSALRVETAKHQAYLRDRARLRLGSDEMKKLDELREAEAIKAGAEMIRLEANNSKARLSIFEKERDTSLQIVQARLSAGLISERQAAEQILEIRQSAADSTYASRTALLDAEAKLREANKQQELADADATIQNESTKASKLLAVKRTYTTATFASQSEIRAAEREALKAFLGQTTEEYQSFITRLEGLATNAKSFLKNAFDAGEGDTGLISGLESRITKAAGNNRALKAIQDEFEKLGIRINVFNTSEESVKNRTLLIEQARLKIETAKLAIQERQAEIETRLANLKSQTNIAESQAKIESGTLTPNQLRQERVKIQLETAKMQAQTEAGAVSSQGFRNQRSLLNIDKIIAGAQTDSVTGNAIDNLRLEDVKVPLVNQQANEALAQILESSVASVANSVELGALARERNDILRRIEQNTTPTPTPRQTGR